MNTWSLRASLLAASLGAALSAHAVAIDLSSTGTIYSSFGTSYDSETVTSQQGGLGTLSNLGFYFLDEFGFPAYGSGSYTGSGGTLHFSLYFSQGVDVFGGTGEDVGTWTATGGTGSYAGAVGSGTLTTHVGGPSASMPERSVSDSRFLGTIDAVPEPSALAALGLAGLAVLRRRRP